LVNPNAARLTRLIRLLAASVAALVTLAVCQLDDLPNATFPARQYGRRVPGRDPWYSMLAADLMSRVVVFVGTILDEPPLWQHLELRGSKSHGRELRPRSFS